MTLPQINESQHPMEFLDVEWHTYLLLNLIRANSIHLKYNEVYLNFDNAHLHNHNRSNCDLPDCMPNPKYNMTKSYQSGMPASLF